MEICPRLEKLDQKLMASPAFQAHVKKFALVDGTETELIRKCSAFKSEQAAIDFFMFLMHPDPGLRWLPETLLRFLKKPM